MSETLTPVFRLEYFITAAANGTPCDLEPIFNEEKYLHAIAGASVDLPMPIGRTQEYLAKLAGMDVEIPDHPIFRTEYYLAHMIDSTVECPAPIFREEMFYYEWASNEYVTITGNPVSFTAKAAPLRKLKVAFSPVQEGTGDPSPDNVRPILGWDSLNVYHSGADTSNPQTISITLGQTVYSGYVDLVTGVGEIDWVGIDGGSLTWKKVNNNSYRTFTATPTPTPQKGSAPSTAINVICDNYKSESFDSASATNDNYIWVSAESADQLCIKDTSRAGMSVAEFTQYMTGMTIVYRLATPIPISLTPQEVQSLAGDNNLWSDANQPITVTYRSN